MGLDTNSISNLTQSTSSNASKISTGKVNLHSGQTSNTSTSATVPNNSSAVALSSISSTPLTTTPVHATRGATSSTCTSGMASGSHTPNPCNSSSSPSDEKIGTRRSVRASAAANKMIYTRGGNHNNSINSGESAGKLPGKTGHGNTSSESVAEARRKTRSAGKIYFNNCLQ